MTEFSTELSFLDILCETEGAVLKTHPHHPWALRLCKTPSCLGSKALSFDLKDMRRLHIPIVLKGQHRWWIRLYTLGLDEAAQNTMILVNLARGKLQWEGKINLFNFKFQLIRKILGERTAPIPRTSIGAARDV